MTNSYCGGDSTAFDSAKLRVIGGLLRTQDNCYTKDPIFQVRGRRRIYGMDPEYGGDNFEWVATMDDFMVVDPPENEDDPPEGIEKLYYTTVEEVLCSCFTRLGCEKHLLANRHRYREYEEVWIYVDSLFRNFEMIEIRNALKALPPPEQP